MKIERTEEGYWLATGQGVLKREIAVEADTRYDAHKAFIEVCSKQEREKAHMEKNRDDYQRLASEARNYKGAF